VAEIALYWVRANVVQQKFNHRKNQGNASHAKNNEPPTNEGKEKVRFGNHV